jgi:hypothetical protein
LIRRPLDSIKALKKNTAIVTDSANELYIRTKILADISPSTGGAEQAAKEIVNGLFSLFEVLFDISSKDLHTKIKNQAHTYEMTPDYLDAEFLLTLALSITNYLIKRIKFSCK